PPRPPRSRPTSCLRRSHRGASAPRGSAPRSTGSTPRVGTSRAVFRDAGVARVLILDPHPMVARALAVALERNADIEVVSTAGSLDEGLPLAVEFHPAVVVVHDPLPDTSIAAATQALRSSARDAGVLVVRSKVTHRFAERALAAGAAGVIDRSAQFAVLEHAVRACTRGERGVITRDLLPGAYGRGDLASDEARGIPND